MGGDLVRPAQLRRRPTVPARRCRRSSGDRPARDDAADRNCPVPGCVMSAAQALPQSGANSGPLVVSNLSRLGCQRHRSVGWARANTGGRARSRAPPRRILITNPDRCSLADLGSSTLTGITTYPDEVQAWPAETRSTWRCRSSGFDHCSRLLRRDRAERDRTSWKRSPVLSGGRRPRSSRRPGEKWDLQVVVPYQTSASSARLPARTTPRPTRPSAHVEDAS